MDKKWLFVLCSICLVFALAVTPSFAAPKAIKISSVLSLTGKMSGMGTQIKPSYEIFAEKVNAEGGIYVKKYGKKIPVDLRVLDDESDPLKCQAQLEVANSWGAVANLGGLGCGTFEMGTPICMKNKMVWIGPGCGGWMPHQLGNEWLFSIFFKTPFFSPLVFDMILDQPKPRPNKVAIFEINQLDAREAGMYWLQAAKVKGFEVVFHKRYPAGTKDFSALITGAKAAGAEILLAYPLPPMGPAIVKQMKELDYSPKLVWWSRAPEGARFGSSLGELADYVNVPCAWSPDLKLPGNDYVIEKYKKKTGKKEADLIVGSAYTALQVLAAAIEKAGTLDRKAIRDAVRATDMETVCGRIRFTDQGVAKDRLIVALQWMGGKTRIVYVNEHGKKYGDKVPVKPLKWQPKWSAR